MRWDSPSTVWCGYAICHHPLYCFHVRLIAFAIVFCQFSDSIPYLRSQPTYKMQQFTYTGSIFLFVHPHQVSLLLCLHAILGLVELGVVCLVWELEFIFEALQKHRLGYFHRCFLAVYIHFVNNIFLHPTNIIHFKMLFKLILVVESLLLWTKGYQIVNPWHPCI